MIKKESSLYRPKFCRSGSAFQHLIEYFSMRGCVAHNDLQPWPCPILFMNQWSLSVSYSSWHDGCWRPGDWGLQTCWRPCRPEVPQRSLHCRSCKSVACLNSRNQCNSHKILPVQQDLQILHLPVLPLQYCQPGVKDLQVLWRLARTYFGSGHRE